MSDTKRFLLKVVRLLPLTDRERRHARWYDALWLFVPIVGLVFACAGPVNRRHEADWRKRYRKTQQRWEKIRI